MSEPTYELRMLIPEGWSLTMAEAMAERLTGEVPGAVIVQVWHVSHTDAMDHLLREWNA